MFLIVVNGDAEREMFSVGKAVNGSGAGRSMVFTKTQPKYDATMTSASSCWVKMSLSYFVMPFDTVWHHFGNVLF